MSDLIEAKCESCSSKEFTRKGDYLVCDYCGSKYYVPKVVKEKPKAAQPQPTYTPVPKATTGKKKSPARNVIITILVIVIGMSLVAGVAEEEGVFDDPMVRQELAVGEEATTQNWKALVGVPEGVTIFEGSFREEVYVKCPLTITATKDCTIQRDNFSMTDSRYPDDALPEELTLKAGETFTGYLYLDWYSASDFRDNDRGLETGSFYNRIRYADYSNEHISITWENNDPSADSVEVNAKTVMSTMPNTVVRLQATYKGAYLDAKNPEAVFTLADPTTPYPVAVSVTPSFKAELANLKEGDTVTLRGTLNALQARTPESTTVREIVLSNPSIVK